MVNLRSFGSFVVVCCAIVALYVAPRTAAADCMGRLVTVYPEHGATGVPTNTRLLVHVDASYASGAPLREDVALWRLVPASGASVALAIESDRAWSSTDMARRTIVLRPLLELAPGTRYVLARGAPGPRGSQAFTTGAARDTAAPAAAAASAGAFATTEFGCGPAHQIPITVLGARDAGGGSSARLWVRLRVAATAADLAAGRTVGEVIEALGPGGVVPFGHGMCVGCWPLDPGAHLVAGATLLDSAMNESGPLGPPLTLNAGPVSGAPPAVP